MTPLPIHRKSRIYYPEENSKLTGKRVEIMWWTQQIENTTALEALEKGLDDLMDLCEVVTEKFTNTRDEFHASQETHMRT
jgi:hypothetical protein